MDWTLQEVHGALRAAADRHHELVQIDAYAQRATTGAILPGAGSDDDFWIFVVTTDDRRGSRSSTSRSGLHAVWRSGGRSEATPARRSTAAALAAAGLPADGAVTALGGAADAELQREPGRRTPAARSPPPPPPDGRGGGGNGPAGRGARVCRITPTRWRPCAPRSATTGAWSRSVANAGHADRRVAALAGDPDGAPALTLAACATAWRPPGSRSSACAACAVPARIPAPCWARRRASSRGSWPRIRTPRSTGTSSRPAPAAAAAELAAARARVQELEARAGRRPGAGPRARRRGGHRRDRAAAPRAGGAGARRVGERALRRPRARDPAGAGQDREGAHPGARGDRLGAAPARDRGPGGRCPGRRGRGRPARDHRLDRVPHDAALLAAQAAGRSRS